MYLATFLSHLNSHIPEAPIKYEDILHLEHLGLVSFLGPVFHGHSENWSHSNPLIHESWRVSPSPSISSSKITHTLLRATTNV